MYSMSVCKSTEVSCTVHVLGDSLYDAETTAKDVAKAGGYDGLSWSEPEIWYNVYDVVPVPDSMDTFDNVVRRLKLERETVFISFDKAAEFIKHKSDVPLVFTVKEDKVEVTLR